MIYVLRIELVVIVFYGRLLCSCWSIKYISDWEGELEYLGWNSLSVVYFVVLVVNCLGMWYYVYLGL